ncbi:MAG: hypothetical protein QY326_00545 [Bdellovibrionota bacterium]|nr:MAG: hypothetical protein QY326_00545 [Bdellovibrionota bacterium]
MFEARRRMLRAELKAAESKMAEAEAVLKRARQREAEMKSERAEIGAAAIEEGAE